MSRILASAVALLCAGGFATRPAAADPSRAVYLSWVELPGAEGCGGALAMAKQVEELLGRRVLVPPSQADLSIEGHVERQIEPVLWRAVVELRDARGSVLGTRELTSDTPDCDALRDSAALAIALMIDPSAPLHPARPLPVAQPPVSARQTEAPAAKVAHATVPWRIVSSVEGIVGLGILPQPAPGVQMDIMAMPSRFWAVEVFGRDYAAQRQSVAPGASVRLELAAGGLTICPLRSNLVQALALDFCAGGELAAIESEGIGFSVSQPQTVLVVRLLASTHVLVRLGGPFAIRVGAEVGVAIAREDFVLEGIAGGASRDVFNPSLVAAAADLGLSVSVP